MWGRDEPGLPFPRCSEHLGSPAASGGCLSVLERAGPRDVPLCAARTSQGGWAGAGAATDTADGAGRAAAAPSII